MLTHVHLLLLPAQVPLETAVRALPRNSPPCAPLSLTKAFTCHPLLPSHITNRISTRHHPQRFAKTTESIPLCLIARTFAPHLENADIVIIYLPSFLHLLLRSWCFPHRAPLQSHRSGRQDHAPYLIHTTHLHCLTKNLRGLARRLRKTVQLVCLKAAGAFCMRALVYPALESFQDGFSPMHIPTRTRICRFSYLSIALLVCVCYLLSGNIGCCRRLTVLFFSFSSVTRQCITFAPPSMHPLVLSLQR